jgi:hypothetical protein
MSFAAASIRGTRSVTVTAADTVSAAISTATRCFIWSPVGCCYCYCMVHLSLGLQEAQSECDLKSPTAATAATTTVFIATLS